MILVRSLPFHEKLRPDLNSRAMLMNAIPRLCKSLADNSQVLREAQENSSGCDGTRVLFWLEGSAGFLLGPEGAERYCPI